MSAALLIVFAAIWVFAAAYNNNFNARPNFWLIGISISIVAPILAATLMQYAPQIVYESPLSTAGIGSLNTIDDSIFTSSSLMSLLLLIYSFGVVFIVSKTLAAYIKLMIISSRQPSANYKNFKVILTDKEIPPCSFGFVRPKILMPRTLSESLTAVEKNMIYAHESAHIERHDQRVYIMLLLVRAVAWPHLAVADMINRWQMASELRADSFVLKGRPKSQRTEYGKILLGILRTKSGGALPCPSATLHLSSYRSAKMRVINIMNPNQFSGKRHNKKIGLGAVVLLFVGTMGMSALASEGVSPDRNAQPMKRVPPQFPANCPVNDGEYAAKVKLKFDVNKAGQVMNVRVTDSTNPCFNGVSINSVKAWLYRPNIRKLKNVETFVTYKISK